MSAAGPVRKAADSRNDWETPHELFTRLNDEFDFTLDGAANKDNTKCKRYLSNDPVLPINQDRNLGDAFKYQPEGETIWLNPPYGQGIEEWLKLADRWSWLNRVVILLPNSTDTRWFEALVQFAYEIRLLIPRVKFLHTDDCVCKACREGKKGSNTGGSIVAVAGKRTVWAQRSCHIWSWRWEKE